jgi:phosphate transport system permease protein
MTTATSSIGATGRSLKAVDRLSRVRILRNNFWTFLCIVLSFLTLIPLFSIVFLLLQKGIPLLKPSVFAELPPAPGLTGGGFGNAIQGTAVMVGLALLFSTPLGILSAIYLNEYSPKSRLANAVRFVAKLLTGIPSIICGVFAFSVIVLSTDTASALAGGVALAVLTLPTSFAEQALPGSACGSLLWARPEVQTIFRIVLPALCQPS